MTIRTTKSPQHRTESRTRFSRRSSVPFARIAFMIALLIAGCSTAKNHYTYKTVPKELLAKKVENPQTLDLTQLARPTSNSELIDRGDVIEISISAGLTEKDTTIIPVRLTDDGIADLPEIGPIRLAGVDMQTAETMVVAACIERQLYRKPSVTVTMKRQRMNRVTVTGAVKKPGRYELPRNKSDLFSALNAAEGLEKDAGTKVEIRNPGRSGRNGRNRPTPIASGLQPGVNSAGHSVSEAEADEVSLGGGESLEVDLVSATKSRSNDYLIEDGGTVHVEKRDPEPLYVIGQVKKPDKFEFPVSKEIRVADAIALGGGLAMSVADKIYVIRKIPNSSESAVIQVSLREAKRNLAANIQLEPGDVVSVENTPATAIYETLQTFRFSAGMSIPALGLF